jgi:phosphoglycerate dehydrogenase-like enzyme
VNIWCNGNFGPEGTALLEKGVGSHALVFAAKTHESVLSQGKSDAALASADIAFGQPDPADCLANRRLKWIELSSAGYTRYDNTPFKEAMRARGTFLTNASQVYADACAEHALAMMLADCRQLLPSYKTQLDNRGWPQPERRANSRLLARSTVVLLGFGAIGRRLAELLVPFGARVIAVRRQIKSEPGVRVVPEEMISQVLGEADHVVNVLPENQETRGYVNARRIACFKPRACFYNVGRGATVDQPALIEALASGRVRAAYLDVTSPEPLPPTDPLWTAPNCYITPHTAGGRQDESLSLVRHFLANLETFAAGGVMTDRVL